MTDEPAKIDNNLENARSGLEPLVVKASDLLFGLRL
jgi:hypothetical protein